MDDAHGFHCSNMQLEQCQMIICKFIAAVQYINMHVATAPRILHDSASIIQKSCTTLILL